MGRRGSRRSGGRAGGQTVAANTQAWGGPRWPRALLLAPATVMAVWGCTGDSSPGSSEDAGPSLQVIMNAVTEDRWSISDRPAVVIGDAGGDSSSELFNVVGVGRLSDGRIVVANSGSHEIRFFDSGGAFLSASGGEGEGPGEFRRIANLMTTPEDSILVWDGQNLRVSVFGADGELARDFRLKKSTENAFPTLLGRFGDGTLLARAAQVIRDTPADGAVLRLQNFFMRYSPTGQPLDTLGRFTTPGSLIKHIGNGGLSIYMLPFDPGTRWAIRGRGLYATYGGRDAVREISGMGDVTRIIRVEREPRPVTPRLRKAAIDALLERYTDFEAEQRARTAYDEAEFPPEVQAFDRLLVDVADHLWARRTPLPGEPLAAWDVFEPGGDLIAFVEIPEGVAVWQIGVDYVLGSTRDALGVEQVVVYGLTRWQAESASG